MELAAHDLRLEGVGPWSLTVMAGGGQMRVMGYCELDAPPRFPRRVWSVGRSGRFERVDDAGKGKKPDAIDLAALSAIAKELGFDPKTHERFRRCLVPKRSERRRKR